MCQFKSGIILKNKIVIAQGADDSHSNLLDELNIEDNTENAMRRFVRAELVPPNNEWWTDPDTWIVHIDQDITPEWFDIDRERYEADFREAVKDWCKVHIMVDKMINELSSGYYMLRRCEVKKLLNDVKVLLDNSTVTEMRGNSTVTKMWGNSTVTKMWDNSTVTEMLGNSIARDYNAGVIRISPNCKLDIIKGAHDENIHDSNK